LGEFGLIDALTEVLGTSELAPDSVVLVGPGDDAAVVQMSDSRMVISTDAMVENVHFKRAWSSGIDVGVRVAAANLSDIVAMGADPTALVVALGLPSDLPVEWALDLARGMKQEADRLNVVVVGGDVVASPIISVTVTAIGAPRERIITRAGAQVGDVMAVAGSLGWAEAGLAVANRGFTSPRVLVDANRPPVIDYDLIHSAFDHAHALCDVSDGLVADASHMAKASQVQINITTEALAIADPLRDMGLALTENPMNWILTGGDDHAFLGAFDEANVPTGWTIVGHVLAGSGVTVDGSAFIGPAGHTHFAQ
ncbi:MAG: thiamine-phosphate kinase, partial [Actinobacteria bacterium]|nr:thiamine-phosphate kinase [Actinomycetota bacterium]